MKCPPCVKIHMNSCNNKNKYIRNLFMGDTDEGCLREGCAGSICLETSYGRRKPRDLAPVGLPDPG